MNEIIKNFSGMSRAARIGAVVSIIWLILVFVVSLDESSRQFRFNVSEFLSGFLILGVLPVLLGWGISWIRKANK